MVAYQTPEKKERPMPQGESPEVTLVQRLSALGLTLATAESCSGGLIAHRITNVPGASDCFAGGVVAYSNAVKMEVLGVSWECLEKHGAVSAETVTEMARGVLKRFSADVAVAVSGIAGPGGGTAKKPVGLVYIAVAKGGEARVESPVFKGDRGLVKEQTAERALTLLGELVE